VVVAVGDDTIRLLEQRFGNTDHFARLRIAQVSRVKVSQPDPIEAIGILQQGRQPPVRMRAVQFLAPAVMDDGGVDERVVLVAYSCPGEEHTQVRKGFELRHGVAAVAVADAIVGSSDVVEIHTGPEPGASSDHPVAAISRNAWTMWNG
jgi:hypothetical protein